MFLLDWRAVDDMFYKQLFSLKNRHLLVCLWLLQLTDHSLALLDTPQNISPDDSQYDALQDAWLDVSLDSLPDTSWFQTDFEQQSIERSLHNILILDHIKIILVEKWS